MVQKAEVEIKEKEKSPTEQVLDKVLKQLEIPVQPPPIEETLDKVKQALDQAHKMKPKVRKTWHCTECGDDHIQLYLDGMGSGHFSVDLLDDEPVRSGTEDKITGRDKKNMDMARAKSGK
jgi:hypothetical protein